MRKKGMNGKAGDTEIAEEEVGKKVDDEKLRSHV